VPGEAEKRLEDVRELPPEELAERIRRGEIHIVDSVEGGLPPPEDQGRARREE